MTAGPRHFRQQTLFTLRYLFEFLKNPLHRISILPDWGWTHLIVVLMSISLISGALTGIISLSKVQFFYGLFLLPFIMLLIDFGLTSFFYYYFQVFEKRIVSFRKIGTLVLFANIPFFLFQIISSLFAPFTFVGLAILGVLLVVGLSENFNLEKRKALRLVGLLFFMVFSIWAWNKFQDSKFDRQMSMPSGNH